MWNDMGRIRADQAQHCLQQNDRGDAVDVVVAVDEDRFAVADGTLDPVTGRTDAVNSGGIVQIGKSRSDESAVVILGRDAAAHENVSEDRMDGKRDVRDGCGKNPIVVDQWLTFFKHPHFTELLEALVKK